MHEPEGLPQPAPSPVADGTPVPVGEVARLALRYRPLADVLIGMVDPDHPPDDHRANSGAVVSTRAEALDADARLVWSAPEDGETDARSETLHSFELVHARTRWEAHGLTMLHPGLAEACIAEVRRHTAEMEQQPDAGARLTYRGQSTIELPRVWLARTATTASASKPGSQAHALQVARALEAFADGIEYALAHAAPTVFHDEYGNHYAGELDIERTIAERAITMCSAARELACAIADHDALPAPGTSAAARRAVRGGLPLTAGERRQLLQALSDIDDPSIWPDVASSIQSIAHALLTPRQEPA